MSQQPTQPPFAAPEDDAAITHLVHNLVEEAVRSVEDVPMPFTRKLRLADKETMVRTRHAD